MSRFTSRPSSTTKPSPSARGRQSDDEFVTDCKAAYLVTFEDLSDDITSKQQLQSVLQQAGRNPSKKILDKYWTRDTDSLTFHDFVDICKKEAATSENDLMKAFRRIDINGDGYISNSELMKVMTTKGEKMTKQEVQDLIDEVDENDDGKLDYKEFCKMLMSTTEEVKKLARKKLEARESSRSARDRPSSARSLKSDSSHRLGKSITDSEKAKVQTSEKEAKKSEAMNGKNDVNDDDDDIVIGSQVSLKSAVSQSKHSETPKPKPRKSKDKDEGSGETPKPSPRPRGDANKSPGVSRKGKAMEPRDIKSWQLLHSRGSFFVDEDRTVVSHQYALTLSEDTSVWITMEPFTPGSHDSPALHVDTMLFILREKPDHNGNHLVTFTEQRDNKGRFCLRADLQSGRYTLAPFTTGCKLKRRSSQPKTEGKLVRKEDGKYVLTKQFREVLVEIFELCDLDGNGYLSREEFNLFNLRTSGEEVADDEWAIVEDNVELTKGQMTKKGFLDLNQMEAEDNEDDTDELWVTLSSMGYNKALKQDEAACFTLNVYAEERGSAQLRVKGVEAGGDKLSDAVCQSVISKGEGMRIKGMKDLYMYTYKSDVRACVVIENKSRSRVSVELDCSKSKNVVSNWSSLDHTVDVAAKSTVVGFHILPANERHDWNFHCAEPVVM